MTYVTVFPNPNRRHGWMIADREGDRITHHKINGSKDEPETARAAAEAMFPDKRVYLAGDPNPPWKEAA